MFSFRLYRNKDINVKIYWTLKSIPELADLSLMERKRRWKSAYKSVFRHWQTWCGLLLVGTFAGAGSYFFGPAGAVLLAALGGGIYGQIVVYIVLKHYRHRLRGEALK